MLQKLSIRGKILAVVAVPILVLLIAAGFITLTATRDLSESRNADQLIDVVSSSSRLVDALQSERSVVVNYVHSYTDSRSKLAGTRESVNGVGGLLDRLDTVATESENPEDATVAAQARQLFESTLPSIRLQLPTADATEDFPWPEFPADDAQQAEADAYTALASQLRELRAGGGASEALNGVLETLTNTLVQEASNAVAFYASIDGYREQLEAVYTETDGALNVFRARAQDVSGGSSNQRVRDLTRLTVSQLDRVTEMRLNARAIRTPAPALAGFYGESIQSLTSVTDAISGAVFDSQVVSALQAYAASENLIERIRSEEVLVDRILRAGDFELGEAQQLRTIIVETDVALRDAQRVINPISGLSDVPNFGASRSTDLTDQADFSSIRLALQVGTADRVSGERASQWNLQVTEELAVQTPVRNEALAVAADRTGELSQEKLLQTIITLAATAIALILSLVLALVIARRIIGPLRRLTTTATAVRQELPRLVERVAVPGESVDVAEVQIPVESQDEVGRLAEAFNSVNSATLSIASEQAALRASISEMFVNVARRDQVLLNRQLASIDEMERTEDNADTLTKLFALDHLATRMRRNSESLLVLAGIDTGRRLRRAMPLSDVIRTASSEIELYERVQLELDADPHMLGHSALTAAHLFAELLENATVFSDPGSPVIVRTYERDNSFVVEVVDSGIGMTLPELQEANNRVASTAASEILGAQRLGLFVVGRIARRIGARVTIESREGEGTIATVVMPRNLFDLTIAYDTSHTSSTTVNEGMHAPAALVERQQQSSERQAPTPITSSPAATPARTPVASAYQPTVVEGGATLAGRGGAEAPAQASVDDLVRADAVAAPEAIPVDLEALTEGVTPSGLPSRRRKDAPQMSDPQREEQSVIPLPQRATDAQLSALEVEQDQGFTPVITPSEISPESVEERASMFRGFRSRRETEREVEVAPDAESLGQAMRRGAMPEPAAEPENAFTVPSLEFDSPVSASEVVEAAPAAVAPIAEPEPATVLEASPFTPADVRYDSDVAPVTQAPEIVQGHTFDDFEPAAYENTLSTFEVPLLEEDDEPFEPVVEAPVAPVEPVVEAVLVAEEPTSPYVAPATATDEHPDFIQEPMRYQGAGLAADANTGFVPSAPVETPAAPAAPLSPFSFPGAAVSVPAETAQAPTPVEPAVREPLFTPPAVAEDPFASLIKPESTASLDDDSAEDRSGFFGRLFRRGSEKPEDGASPTAITPEAAASLPTSIDPGVFSPGATAAPEVTQPAQVERPSIFGGASFAPAEPAAPAVEPSAPQSFSPDLPAWPQNDVAPETFAPTPQAAPEPAVAANPWEVPAPGAAGASYSPDDLATPLGWESAGASALQAAAPEGAATYTPLDIQPADDASFGPSFTEDVFSEFSSLATERPKSERTKAGLTKRKRVDAPQVEVQPLEHEVTIAAAPRDADAVRNRFSSFYNATQRARQDAAEFDRSAKGDES